MASNLICPQRSLPHPRDCDGKLTTCTQKPPILSITVTNTGPRSSRSPLQKPGQGLSCFGNDDDLAEFAGLTRSRKQSGPFQGDDSRISVTGNVYLR
ncbi:MAG: transposase [Bacillota bacterium]